MGDLFEEYQKADLPKRAALTHAALEWWGATGFNEAALRGENDAGNAHLSGKIHDKMLEQALRPGVVDYLPVALVREAATAVGVTGTNPWPDKIWIIGQVRGFFQRIFNDQLAVIFSPHRRQTQAQDELVAASTPKITDEEGAAGVLLMLREIGLQDSLKGMEDTSRNMAGIAVRIVQGYHATDPRDLVAKRQRDAYDQQIHLLEERVHGIAQFEEVKLITTEEALKGLPSLPVGPAAEELDRLRKEVAALRRRLATTESERDEHESKFNAANKRAQREGAARTKFASDLRTAMADLWRFAENRPGLQNLNARLRLGLKLQPAGQ